MKLVAALLSLALACCACGANPDNPVDVDSGRDSTTGGDAVIERFDEVRRYTTPTDDCSEASPPCFEFLEFLPDGDVLWAPTDIVEDGTYAIVDDVVMLDIRAWPNSRSSLRLESRGRIIVDGEDNIWTWTPLTPVLEGFECTNRVGCPPGFQCFPPDGPDCDDCAGPLCVALENNTCLNDGDCELDGYTCQERHCTPTATCASDDDCDEASFCWNGSNPPFYSQGICVPRTGESCAGPASNCSNARPCVVCVWGELECVEAGSYPTAEICP